MESSTLKDFQLARGGVQIKREHGVAQRRKDTKIRSLGESLRNGQLTIYQYLEVYTHFFEPAVLPIVLPEEPLHSDNSVNYFLQ